MTIKKKRNDSLKELPPWGERTAARLPDGRLSRRSHIYHVSLHMYKYIYIYIYYRYVYIYIYICREREMYSTYVFSFIKAVLCRWSSRSIPAPHVHTARFQFGANVVIQVLFYQSETSHV